MNIYDIAKRAGVSTATVSRIVNHSGKVSSATEQRVRAIMEELNYQPSIFAKGMVTNSMKTVGVLAADIRDGYYAEVTYSVEKILSHNGYNVMLCNTGEEVENKLRYLDLLTAKQVDAVVLVGSVFHEPLLQEKIRVISKKTPVVLINCYLEHENIYCVLNDDTGGTEAALSYLKSIGKTNTVFLTDANTYSSSRKAKPFPEEKVFFVSKGIRGGMEFVRENKTLSFDSVVCSEDSIALGVLYELREKAENVEVIGFNATELSSLFSFASIESNVGIIGEIAVQQLMNVLKKKPCEKKIILNSKLIKQ